MIIRRNSFRCLAIVLGTLALLWNPGSVGQAQPRMLKQQILAIEFGRDGKQLVLAAGVLPQPDRIAVRDLSEGKTILADKEMSNLVAAVFGPKGSALATAYPKGEVKLFDFRTRQWTSVASHTGEVRSLAFSSDGTLLASGGLDRKVKVRETANPAQTRELSGHKEAVTAIAFLHDGRRLVSGSQDGETILWEGLAGQHKKLASHAAAIERIAVSPADSFIATAGRDATIRVSDPISGQLLTTLSVPSGPARTDPPVAWHALAFSPTGHILAAGADDGSIRLWSVATWKPTDVLRGHETAVTALAYSADGETLASGSSDAGVKLWNVATGREYSSPATSLPMAYVPAAPIPTTPPKAVAAVPSLAVLPKDFQQAFGDSWKPASPWKLVGPDASAVTRSDPRGLRITLPAKRKSTELVGLSLPARVKGDFEITAGYEILQADRPREGHGVGFSIELATDTLTRDLLDFIRASRVNEGEVYVTSRITTENGARQYHLSFSPTTARSGFLRLARSGREVTLSASEGASGEFREVGRSELGSEDLILIRLSAYPGHAQNALDLLLKDFRLRSLSKGEAQTLAIPPETPTAPASPGVPNAGRGWAGMVGFVIILILIAVGGTWLYMRWNRPVSEMITSDVVSKSGTPLGRAPKSPASIAVACIACGKTVRARAELAGKRIKCPQCGKAVPVRL